MKKRTPIPAIRARCRGCTESLKEIRECPCPDCQLYEYRTGHRPKGKAQCTPCQAIREYCIWCQGWRGGNGRNTAIRLARECHISDCPIWHLRPGQKRARKPKKGHVQRTGAINRGNGRPEYPEQPQPVQSTLFDELS